MKIAPDKKLQLIAGAIVAFACLITGFGLYALPAAALVGAGKELYDKYTPGRVVDFWDFVYTAIPGLVVTAGWALHKYLA
jgi:hypothetical protein